MALEGSWVVEMDVLMVVLGGWWRVDGEMGCVVESRSCGFTVFTE